jgi:hypothetical protein
MTDSPTPARARAEAAFNTDAPENEQPAPPHGRVQSASGDRAREDGQTPGAAVRLRQKRPASRSRNGSRAAGRRSDDPAMNPPQKPSLLKKRSLNLAGRKNEYWP